MTLYVKKLYSLNPDKYKYIRIETATDNYSRYVANCIDTGHNEWKTFEQWLKTEI